MAKVPQINATNSSVRDRMIRFLEWPFIFFSEATVDDRGAGTSCLRESEIEDLVRGKLSGETEQRCLAHLLWCRPCQHKVDEEAEFARATRGAAEVLERKAAGQRQASGRFRRVFDRVRDWFRESFRTPARTRWVAGALSVCVLAAVAVRLPMRRSLEGETVLLRSERGSVLPATVEGAASANLHLRIDVSDVAPSPAYIVTVVNALGQAMETSKASAADGSADVTLHRRLPSGGYWIRLSAPDGRLLREYALRVR